MKSFLYIVILFAVFAPDVDAQTVKRDIVGCHIGYGWMDYSPNQGLVGAPGYYGKDYYRIGFDYEKPLSTCFSVVTGIYYTYNNVVMESNLPPTVDGIFVHYTKNETVHFITVPVAIKLNFLNYLNIGVGLNFNNIFIIGPRVSAGVHYEFPSGFILKVDADVQLSGFFTRTILYQTGYSAGVAWRLN